MAQKEVRAHLPELVSVGSQSHKQGIRGRMLDGMGGRGDGWMMGE